jgi:hypothetical protein
MIIKITRRYYTDKTTIGEIDIDGESLGIFSLEDVTRFFKIMGKTAIPAGKYMANITYSNRFGRYMLELLAVPGFLFIRMHTGNDEKDTEGCILTGMTRSVDTVYNSVAAYTILWGRVHEYIKDPMKHVDPIWVEVKDTQKPKIF